MNSTLSFILLLAYIAIAIWIYNDGANLTGNKNEALGVGFIALIAGPIGWLAYFIKRKELHRMYEIKQGTLSLQNGATDGKVENLISIINHGPIPNKPEAWNTLRAAYNLVRKSKNVSNTKKERFAVVLQSNGVSGIY